MTMLKINRNNQMPSVLLNTFFDDFFGKENFAKYASTLTVPSVNVSESQDSFQIELAAPGYNKEDFQVSIENKVLKVSAERKQQSEDGLKHIIKEYHYSSFERSFNLPETILQEGIQAKYENGILQLVLPKKEEAKQVGPKTIAIG